MKKTLALFLGLALVATATMVSAQQAPTRGQGTPANAPCMKGQGGGVGKDCPNYGQCQGQQKRYGQGNGFRGGPRDGSGPRRDGTGGQCPNKN